MLRVPHVYLLFILSDDIEELLAVCSLYTASYERALVMINHLNYLIICQKTLLWILNDDQLVTVETLLALSATLSSLASLIHLSLICCL